MTISPTHLGKKAKISPMGIPLAIGPFRTDLTFFGQEDRHSHFLD